MEHFYLTNSWNPNRYYHSGSESNGNEKVLHIPQAPGAKPHNHMQFNAIPRTLMIDKLNNE